MQGFQKMMPQNACVRRGGVQTTINAVDLVRGDIVILSTGARSTLTEDCERFVTF